MPTHVQIEVELMSLLISSWIATDTHVNVAAHAGGALFPSFIARMRVSLTLTLSKIRDCLLHLSIF